MASSSSSGDGPSTTGGRSERLQSWDFEIEPRRVVVTHKNANDLAVKKLQEAVMKEDIVSARKWGNKLRGTGLDKAVEAAKDPNRSQRHSPLHIAASTNYLEMCRMMVKEFKCNPNEADTNGTTPLIFAVQGAGTGVRILGVVKYLVNSGADPNKANNRGITPLHQAARKGYSEVVEFLLSNGAIVDPICLHGETPLHLASLNGNAAIVKLLLMHNAEINRLSHDLHTPLVASLFGSSLECLETFIEARADVSATSPVTPLSVAAHKGLGDCMNRLLNYGANPNEHNEDKKLPIEIAASKGLVKCVEILLPITNPLRKYENLSIDEIVQQETAARLLEEHMAIADGDAAYWEKRYSEASKCYTQALKLGHEDPGLYAKISLCYLYNRDQHRYLDFAISYMNTKKKDSSKPFTDEDAKQSVLDYLKKWKELKAGGNLTDETDGVSREEHP